MYSEYVENQLKEMTNLKKVNDYQNCNIKQLEGLISFNGIWELKFTEEDIKKILKKKLT